MSDDKMERGRLAVECLMLYIEPGEAARAAAGNHIAQLITDPNVGSEKILAGLLDLSTFLGFNLAEQLGAGEEPPDVIEKCRQILRAVSMQQFPRAEQSPRTKPHDRPSSWGEIWETILREIDGERVRHDRCLRTHLVVLAGIRVDHAFDVLHTEAVTGSIRVSRTYICTGHSCSPEVSDVEKSLVPYGGSGMGAQDHLSLWVGP